MAERRWHSLYFDEWVAREGLDLIRGWKVEDVYTVPLKYWARTGGNAVQIQLDGTGELNAACVCEIPPGKDLAPMRHLYEELVYVLSGRGSTSVWYEGQPKQSFEWGEGSLFAVPLNAWYQHFNGSGQQPVRLLAMNTAPVMMNLIRDEDFIFNNDATFPSRYGGDDGYFSGKVELDSFNGWDVPQSVGFSNFFPHIDANPRADSNRGWRAQTAQYELANGVVSAHVLEMPGGAFTKLHRHGPGAHVLWLKGEGYTMMWPDGGEWVQEFWRPGTMLVPPAGWWHQHCMVSKDPAVHLALKLGSRSNSVTRANMNTMKSTRRGGNQMDFEDTPPDVLAKLCRIFEEECAKRGTPANLEAIIGG
jgi:quercetin dioxygenase-like cupin family protein